ncbi:MAG TPA: COQ9 family protein [Stellaceae bacterium]|nr:COQ9 family protein [Stellaceae bacterium]
MTMNEDLGATGPETAEEIGTTEPGATNELVALKDALLEEMLPDVVFDGWSAKALREAAVRLSISREELAAILPGGAGDIALWLDDWADRKMVAALERMGLDQMKVHHRIIAGVRVRLEILAPYREAVRRAIAREISPFGFGHAARAIYRTVDAIWYAAGDNSADFNFYTKRGLLAAVYSATVLYWLDDNSEGHEDTWAFLERRIADVLKLPRLTGQMGQRLRRAARSVTGPLTYLKRKATR